jgi:hypothetical protein
MLENKDMWMDGEEVVKRLNHKIEMMNKPTSKPKAKKPAAKKPRKKPVQ